MIDTDNRISARFLTDGCKRSDVEKTDKNFHRRLFEKGEYIEELDWVCPTEDIGNDTFVWFSIQMRALGLRFKHVQMPPTVGKEMEDYRRRRRHFAKGVEWVHVSSLSMMMYASYIDENDIPIGLRRRPYARPVPFTPRVGQDLWNQERKAAWKLMIMERFWEDLEPIAGFRDLYKEAAERLWRRCELDEGRVKGLAKVYKELVKL